jgi:CMP-2-keto-3-deoxyoctulosonic acid synthetase
MEVEQQRRQGVANAAATVANATDAERVAEADALARAAADERGRAAAASRSRLPWRTPQPHNDACTPTGLPRSRR